MCGNNVTRKYWLIADRPNKAKKGGPFSPLGLVQILWGAMPPPLPTPLEKAEKWVKLHQILTDIPQSKICFNTRYYLVYKIKKDPPAPHRPPTKKYLNLTPTV